MGLHETLQYSIALSFSFFTDRAVQREHPIFAETRCQDRSLLFQDRRMAEADDFELDVTPSDKVVFEGHYKQDIHAQLAIKNPKEVMKAYKVKCTDNHIFVIQPAVGFLKPGSSAVVKIKANTQSNPPSSKHHLVVFHMDPPKEADTARKAWQGYKGQEKRKRLGLQWTEEPPKEEEDAVLDNKEEGEKKNSEK